MKTRTFEPLIAALEETATQYAELAEEAMRNGDRYAVVRFTKREMEMISRARWARQGQDFRM